MSSTRFSKKCRLCRAQGTKLYLKGSRCFSNKCPIEKKGAVPPGMHGLKRRRKSSDYGLQLKAKQKAKRLYAVSERQLRNYFLKAKKAKGVIRNNFLSLLERRLDNVVYLCGFCLSRLHARQLVSHQHVLVNNRPLNIASYLVKVGDKISLDPKPITKLKSELNLNNKDFQAPAWIKLTKKNLTAQITRLPQADDFNQEIDVNLIIEYYSR